MQTISANRALSALLVCLLSLSTACTTMRPIAADGVGDSVRREIKPGDTIRVVTRDGATHTLQVAVVAMTSLGGDVVNSWKGGTSPVGRRFDVRYADITELDVKQLSGLKNAGLVVAAVLCGSRSPRTEEGTPPVTTDDSECPLYRGRRMTGT
jgi:hypothetical protein